MPRKAGLSLEGVTNQAVITLTEFFESDGNDLGLASRAKVAVSVLGVYARLLQGRSAREMATFVMARELAPDVATLQKYLQAATPNAPIIQALPGSRVMRMEEDS